MNKTLDSELHEMPLKDALLICAILVQEKMEDLLPRNFEESNLVSAMRYSALSDGKRIRPFLVMAVANMFGIPLIKSLNTATAIEFVHVYSLIHDDLPAMDNDDFRRGIPTNHKKFDEATAILAGDALLTYAFEILSNPETHSDPAVRCEVTKTLAKSSGFRGMAGGQMIDLEKAKQKISNDELVRLHRLKTGELFMAAAEMGAIIAQAGSEQRSYLRHFAHDLGLAFQIKDDLLDHRELDETKSDENASIVDILGVETAKKQLILLKEQAINYLKPFGKKADLLIELVNFLVERKN